MNIPYLKVLHEAILDSYIDTMMSQVALKKIIPVLVNQIIMSNQTITVVFSECDY